MYFIATTENTVRWYAIAPDGKSFELLDKLDLERINGYRDKATAKAAAQAIGLKTWRYLKLGAG